MNPEDKARPEEARETLTVKEFASREGVFRSAVYAWLKEDRLPGAAKTPRGWRIPATATRPPDERLNPGHRSLKGLKCGDRVLHRATGRVAFVREVCVSHVYFTLEGEPPFPQLVARPWDFEEAS